MSTETITDAELHAAIGAVAYREYEGAKPVYHDKLRAWGLRLADLDDEMFLDEAAAAIHGSALCNSFRGNWDHEHCKGSAVYHEAVRRHLAAGHAEDCRADTLYTRAWNATARSQGHDGMIRPPVTCDCLS